MSETEFLEAKVRSLENEIRALRETRRDEFAKAALTGLFSMEHHLNQHGELILFSKQGYEVWADQCFKIADAMLEARAK